MSFPTHFLSRISPENSLAAARFPFGGKRRLVSVKRIISDKSKYCKKLLWRGGRGRPDQ
jgi:hypothetical protein